MDGAGQAGQLTVAWAQGLHKFLMAVHTARPSLWRKLNAEVARVRCDAVVG